MELFRKVTGYGEAERRVEILWEVRWWLFRKVHINPSQHLLELG